MKEKIIMCPCCKRFMTLRQCEYFIDKTMIDCGLNES